MTHNMFKEIEQLDVLIEKADTARKNTGSNTVMPSGQGEQWYYLYKSTILTY